jgi:putative nucleotidyltransferase with HDIG domain
MQGAGGAERSLEGEIRGQLLGDRIPWSREGGATKPAGSNGGSGLRGDQAGRVLYASSQIAIEVLIAADPDIAAHCEDVEILVGRLCKRLGIRGEERRQIEVAGRLHDIGKIAMPRRLLDKPGPLDDAERELIRHHTLLGERILSQVPELQPVATLVRHSHEHFDGSGYPDGLRGDEIPFGSRIILCADAFQAIRSDQPHRVGRRTREALAEIEANSGSQFDPSVVIALSNVVARARRADDRWMPRRFPALVADPTAS